MAYDLSNLIPELRLKLGESDATKYKYTDEWLDVSLIAAVKLLSKWWNFKYLLDSNNNVTRNPRLTYLFDEDSYGVLEQGDDQIIIIYAAIITAEGELEKNAWDLGSWKDAEISFSNIQSGKTSDDILIRWYNELKSYLVPPNKRLLKAQKYSLPGYKDNKYETGG